MSLAGLSRTLSDPSQIYRVNLAWDFRLEMSRMCLVWSGSPSTSLDVNFFRCFCRELRTPGRYLTLQRPQWQFEAIRNQCQTVVPLQPNLPLQSSLCKNLLARIIAHQQTRIGLGPNVLETLAAVELAFTFRALGPLLLLLLFRGTRSPAESV